MRKLWGVVCQHLARWKRRIFSIKEMRVDGFEIFNLALLSCLLIYFSTDWFTGPYTLALRHAVPLWLWRTVIGLLAFLTALGFLEENYFARRTASSLTALFIWTLGVASAVVWPHWFIGYLFCLISTVPAWLWSKFAEYYIQDASRQQENSAKDVTIVDSVIVKLPRRA